MCMFCAVRVGFFSRIFRWDEDEKTEELKGQDARFILIWNKRPGNSEESSNKQPSRTGQDLCGFVNFRFTLQGEVVNAMEGRPALMLYEINFKEEVDVYDFNTCQNLLTWIC